MDEIEHLQKLVSETESMSDFLRAKGLKTNSGNFQLYWNKFSKYNISTSHWRGKEIAAQKLKAFQIKKATPLEFVLVENSFYNRQQLKKDFT